MGVKTVNRHKRNRNTETHIKCMYTNARSLTNKIGELELIMLKENYDIVGITETWLDDRYDWAGNLQGYSLLRKKLYK